MSVGSEPLNIVLATGVVLLTGISVGYLLRRTGLHRRLATPICALIVVPAWLVLGVFHLLWWQRIAIVLLLYPGAVMCVGTSIGSRIAGMIGRNRS